MTTLRTAAQLCEHGYVPPGHRQKIEKVTARYAVALPESLAALIDRNDPADPIARQRKRRQSQVFGRNALGLRF